MAFGVERGHKSELAREGAPLMWAILVVLLLHGAQLLIFPGRGVGFSRVLTAMVPMLAAGCALWRSMALPARERVSWRWMALTMLLWASGQIVEVFMPGVGAASNLQADASDLFYLSAALPLLLAIGHTTENEAIPAVFYLGSAQLVLAVLLIYMRIFRVSESPSAASNAMFRIYAWECGLLAVFAALRLLCWNSREERQRMKWMATTIWTYLPIELGMDYASSHWHLRAGTLLDLLWSVPFALAGRRALSTPLEWEGVDSRPSPSRMALLMQSLCPMLVTVALFVLASSLLGQHPVLAKVAILGLLILQGLHAAIVQMNYFSGQQLLLEREHELEVVNAGLFHLSHIDPLTGIPNRRGFSEALQSAWLLAAREQRPIALVIIDLDFFKGINDRYGHAYGDECLVAVARTLLIQGARAGDHLARYGGEEFVLLLPNTNLDGARAVAERMHRAVSSAGIVNIDSPYGKRLTVSIGVTAAQPNVAAAPGMLVETADQALYQAKRGGRNRVCAQELAELSVSAAG